MGLSENEKTRLKGCVQKKDLVHGEIYYGECRNASFARWNADLQVFVYIRQKFGSTFTVTIKHPEDDDGFDLFWPYFALSTFTIPQCHEEKELKAK